jgi:O-antigen/teichoic acid export membrane protein
MALIPFGVLFLAKNSRQLFVLIGTAWAAVSTVFLIAILKNLSYQRRDILPQAKKLLIYGLQRVLGDFGRAALLSLPATFTAHLSGIQKAGAVAFGVSLLNMVGSVFAPIGLILLPKASQLVAAKDLDTLKYYVRRILAVTVLLTAAGILIFELFAGRILELYLGRSYSDLLVVTRIIMAGSLAYTVYVSLRSVIDAFYVKAVNTLNIFIALVLFCGLSLVGILHFKNDLLIVIGFVLAVYILGFLTMRETRKILKSMETLSSGPQTKK